MPSVGGELMWAFCCGRITCEIDDCRLLFQHCWSPPYIIGCGSLLVAPKGALFFWGTPSWQGKLACDNSFKMKTKRQGTPRRQGFTKVIAFPDWGEARVVPREEIPAVPRHMLLKAIASFFIGMFRR